MSTLDDRITDLGASLSNARKKIISAINDKGVTCEEDVKLSALPSYIKKIASSENCKVLAKTSDSSVSGSITMTRSGTLFMFYTCPTYTTDGNTNITVNGTKVWVPGLTQGGWCKSTYGIVDVSAGDVVSYSIDGQGGGGGWARSGVLLLI